MSTPNTPGSAAPVQNAAPTPAEAPEAEGIEAEEVESTEEGSVQEAAADAEAVLDDPNATKAEKAAAKKMLKSLKIKVDGKEYDEELPFEIEDDPKKVQWMQRQLQLAKVSQKRMQEKSEIENEVREFIEELRNNPEAVLSNPNLGIDLKKFAAQIIEAEIENEKKSPEQRELEKARQELKALKEAQEKEKEAAKKREMERIQQEAYDRYDMQMEQAFEKNKDIPKSPYYVKKISDYMLVALNNGIDVTPEDVIPFVREEARNELKQIIAASGDDVMEELLGKERLTAYQKKRLAKAKAAKAQVPPKVVDTGQKAPEQKEEPKKVTIKDFFKV